MQPHERSAFLVALAKLLRNEPEIGDGTVNAAIRSLVREFWQPPMISTPQAPRLSARAHAEKPIWASAQK